MFHPIHLILNWLVSAFALWLVARIIPGIQVRDFAAALIATVMIAIVNAILGPIVRFVAFPITFLTQRDARADKVAGLELGADDYVTKPFDVEELRLRIQGSLRRSTREALQDPRIGLPTNALIEEMRQILSPRPGFTQLNAQLVGFNAFRDKYGFVAADEALAYTGQALTETLAAEGTPNDFVGTNSEERYTIFTFAPDVNAFVEALNNRFSEGAKKFYNFMDMEQGFVLIHEATDEEQHIPLMHFVISPVAEGAMPSR